ncbi:hypothetical protein D9M68_762160 [compost metagenome]
MASFPSSADCKPVTVLMAWAPVWLARASRVASPLFAVALLATPSSLVLSAALMKPATVVVTNACTLPPPPKWSLSCRWILPNAASTVSVETTAPPVARLKPLSTTASTRAALW